MQTLELGHSNGGAFLERVSHLQGCGEGQQMISPVDGYERVTILGKFNCWIMPFHIWRVIKARITNGAGRGSGGGTRRGLDTRKLPLCPSEPQNELSFIAVAH